MELLDIEAEQFDYINIQQYPIFLQKAGGCDTALQAVHYHCIGSPNQRCLSQILASES